MTHHKDLKEIKQEIEAIDRKISNHVITTTIDIMEETTELLSQKYEFLKKYIKTKSEIKPRKRVSFNKLGKKLDNIHKVIHLIYHNSQEVTLEREQNPEKYLKSYLAKYMPHLLNKFKEFSDIENKLKKL